MRVGALLGRTPTETRDTVTGRDFALYQAWAEEDGPWWGGQERELLCWLCSINAAQIGADIPPEDFRWTFGGADDRAAKLLPPAEGLAILAARYGADLVEQPCEGE